MIINNINDNGSGPWGSGNDQNPWGKRPNSNGTPPDVDQMLKESKDKLKKIMPTGFGGGKGFTVLLFVLLAIWLMTGIYELTHNNRVLAEIWRMGQDYTSWFTLSST